MTMHGFVTVELTGKTLSISCHYYVCWFYSMMRVPGPKDGIRGIEEEDL